jgi:hypothetical protein
MEHSDGNSGSGQSATRPRRSWRHYWKTPVCFGFGFCILQILVAIVRFGTMDSGNPTNLLFAIPSIVSGLILFFLAGLLVGLLAQYLLKGVVGPWRTWILVGFAVATPFAVLFSLVGGLLGPHMVVIGALVPYLLLAGIPLLIRRCLRRFHSPPTREKDPTAGCDGDGEAARPV